MGERIGKLSRLLDGNRIVAKNEFLRNRRTGALTLIAGQKTDRGTRETPYFSKIMN